MSTRSAQGTGQGTNQGTAQVIPFPLRGRRVLAEPKPATPSAARLEAQAAAIGAGEAWYHEAAIQDAKR